MKYCEKMRKLGKRGWKKIWIKGLDYARGWRNKKDGQKDERKGHPLTGGEGWCSHLVHHKYIARKWTKYQSNTHSGCCKYIQNIPSQFPCNFPTMENLEYFCNVPSGGIAISQLGNWWEHLKGSQRMCLWYSGMEHLRCSLQFPN